MTRSSRACLHGVTVVALAAGSLAAGCTSAVRGTKDVAWNRYIEAEAAYEDCRSQTHRAPPPCEAERAAYKAARERYHAETGAAPPASH